MARFNKVDEILEADRNIAKRRRKAKKQKYVKNILQTIFLAGAICVAATSPFFLTRIIRKYFRSSGRVNNFLCAFDYLKNKGLIRTKERNGQIYIFLSKKGKKKAGKYQINDLEIKKPEKWDGFWRVVIFDIPNEKRMKREAFRGKIKELGFYKLQKSVWIYPYECNKEIELLKSFFGLRMDDIRVILAKEIGMSKEIEEYFKPM